MNIQVWMGILIPFIGTALGAACVCVMRGQLKGSTQRILAGFAAGVMMALDVALGREMKCRSQHLVLRGIMTMGKGDSLWHRPFFSVTLKR